MSDTVFGYSVPPGATAGAMIRAAREKQGVHIAVLAAAIKISPRKLDALENDRYHELPDATFTRALAQTVCRALKIDAQPVLALLPSNMPPPLEQVSKGLNAPFRERMSGTDLSAMLPRAPLVWAALALFCAAALMYYWPATELQPRTPVTVAPVLPAASAIPAPAEPPASVSAAASMPASAAVPGLLPPVATGASSAPLLSASAPSLPDTPVLRPSTGDPSTLVPAGVVITVSEAVWLQVRDAEGTTVFQRTVEAGETLNFDQAPPLKLILGNAQAAKLTFRGEPVDLAPLTRGSVAKVTLK